MRRQEHAVKTSAMQAPLSSQVGIYIENLRTTTNNKLGHNAALTVTHLVTLYSLTFYPLLGFIMLKSIHCQRNINGCDCQNAMLSE